MENEQAVPTREQLEDARRRALDACLRRVATAADGGDADVAVRLADAAAKLGSIMTLG